MNKFKITICGKEFSLQTEEEPKYYIELAKKLDTAIMDMSRASDNLTVFSSAVLTALSAFEEVQKVNDSMDNIRKQIKEYVDDAHQARIERDEAKKHEKELKAKVASLENEINILKMQKNIEEQLTIDIKDIKPKTNRF